MGDGTLLAPAGVPVALLPYQHRVVRERLDLATKVNALEKFVQGAAFHQIDPDEQHLLTEQLEHMAMYLAVLEKRVNRITGAEEYECHKRVLGRPMLRGQYNALRGWEMPLNENPMDEGYLVEHLDGGEPNHPDFVNYISWSPKAVFDSGYKEIQ